MKNKLWLYAIGSFLVILIISVILGPQKNKPVEPLPEKQKRLSVEQVKYLEDLQIRRYLVIKTIDNTAYIEPAIWNSIDTFTKESFTKSLAIYCYENGHNGEYITVYDKQNGNKVAKYNSWGFETY